VLEEVERWLEERSWSADDRPLDRLLAAKRATGRTVSVVLPALNEEATVGEIAATIRRELMGEAAPLVDELVVVDSGSTDRTAEVAAAAGARVVHRDSLLPELPALPGKGEVLWRSLAATSGDVIVFLDSDLVDMGPEFVVSLLGPLLTVEDVALVKGFYHRPLRLSEADATLSGGGRVTELTARPVLAALRPELSGVVQPLGGEYAGTRALLESVPFAAGYGVEIGLLLDTHRTRGLDAIGQVDLGVRKHRHRSLRELGATAAEVLDAALRRCVTGHPGADPLVQFVPVDGDWWPDEQTVATTDRPPLASLRGTGT
jgi:glucosyl-3-phosphoglycerate synthase